MNTIVNTATADGSNTNTATANWSLKAGGPITTLSATKTGPTSVAVGVNFDYVIKITNGDPTETALDVEFTDDAPPKIVFVSVTSSQNTLTFTPTLISGNLGDIAPGASVTVTITAKATA